MSSYRHLNATGQSILKSSLAPHATSGTEPATSEMKKQINKQVPRRGRRDLFAELSEGFKALADERVGKRTLRTHPVTFQEPPEITAEELVRLRHRLNMSRAVFAACLRTHVRTLENWEQGRARPNAQAALLIQLVSKYPDTVQRLAGV